MAKITDGDTEGSELKAQGVSTVKGLADVGQRMFALQQKRSGGKKLTKRELKQLAELESDYRQLEQNLRELMRPRERDSSEEPTHAHRGIN